MAYSESYFTARESWRDWRIEAEWLIAAARVTSGSRVLEIGCGGGGLLRMLRARGADAAGVDTLETALSLANVRRTSEVRRASLVRIGEDAPLPFCAVSFDAIIAQHAVEHLPGVDAALREWQRLLKPGGRLALATPNARYPDPAHFADADHAHIFSARELRDAVTRAGFFVESCQTIFPFLSHVRALRALGVIAYGVFQRAPYFATHGRTILLAAQK